MFKLIIIGIYLDFEEWFDALPKRRQLKYSGSECAWKGAYFRLNLKIIKPTCMVHLKVKMNKNIKTQIDETNSVQFEEIIFCFFAHARCGFNQLRCDCLILTNIFRCITLKINYKVRRNWYFMCISFYKVALITISSVFFCSRNRSRSIIMKLHQIGWTFKK
jgi:hypothetical protein